MAKKNPPVRPLSLGRQLMFAASATSTMCNRMLEEYDLTLAQWVVLAALWQRDDLTVGELSDYSGNNIPATSRILDRMIEKHLVARKVDPHDRRVVRISLSRKGADLRHLARLHERVNRELLRGVSSEHAELLYDVLARVEENAQRWIDAT